MEVPVGFEWLARRPRVRRTVLAGERAEA